MTGTPVRIDTRSEEVRQVLMDPRFGRSSLFAEDTPPPLVVPDMSSNPDGPLGVDGPAHLKLRRTAQAAFAPRVTARWRPQVPETADSLPAAFAERPPAGNAARCGCRCPGDTRTCAAVAPTGPRRPARPRPPAATAESTGPVPTRPDPPHSVPTRPTPPHSAST